MRGQRSHSRAAALLLSLLLLSGCYAELDWRELKSTEGGFKVLMPARANKNTGPMGTGAGNAILTLWTAEAAGAVFGAGYADFPETADIAGSVASQLATARDGLARNVRGKVTSEQAVRVANLSGHSLIIEGFAADRSPRVVHARLYASGRRLYELAVIARPGALTEADLEMFFGSFTPG